MATTVVIQVTVIMAVIQLTPTMMVITAATPLRITGDTRATTPRPITVPGTGVLFVPHTHTTAGPGDFFPGVFRWGWPPPGWLLLLQTPPPHRRCCLSGPPA